MQTVFRISPFKKLLIGNDILLIDNGESWAVHPPRPYIALVLLDEHGNAPGEPPNPDTPSTLAVLKPHEARAMASVILSAATEARS